MASNETVKMWAIFKDGALYKDGLCPTKENLLIGYDIISLRGLDVCEQRLVERGMIPTEVDVKLCTEGTPTFYWETVNGKLTTDQDSGHASYEEEFLWRCLHWKLRGILEPEERTALGYYFWATDWKTFKVKDRRRKTTHQKMKASAAAVFQKIGVAFVPILVTKLEVAHGE